MVRKERKCQNKMTKSKITKKKIDAYYDTWEKKHSEIITQRNYSKSNGKTDQEK